MGAKSTLSDIKKALILGHIKSGKLSLSQIASLESVSVSSVKRIKQKHQLGIDVFKTEHHLSGRKKKTSLRTDRKIIKMVFRDSSVTSKAIQDDLISAGVIISRKTILRRLAAEQLQERHRTKQALLKQKKKTARRK